MKKTLALLLAFVLLAAMFPAASAAQEKNGVQIQTAELLEVMNETSEAPEVGEILNYFVPTFEMYGMTVVQGETMILSGVVDDGSFYEFKAGAMVFRGTMDQITEDSEPVWSNLGPTENSNGYVEKLYWDTKGMKTGDYTAILFLTDADENVLFASACDVYISSKEIPLERLGIYVMELGKETEQVRVRAGERDSLSLAVVRYPYHTTDRRTPVFTGIKGDFNYGYAQFPIPNDGIVVPAEAGEYLIQGFLYDEEWNAEFSTELKVIVEEDVGQFPAITALDGNTMCFGQEKGFRIDMPQGSTLEDALVQISVPGLVEVTRVEDNVIYLKGLKVNRSRQHMTVALGDRFVERSVESKNHADFSRYVTEPTCTEPGVRSHTCGDCGLVWYEDVEPKGHRIKKGAEIIVIEEPKATKYGLSGGACERCGELATFETSKIFYDTQPDWFYSDALDYCYEAGIINGLDEHTFGPTATLNRAQLVTMLYRHAGSPAVEGECTFADVPVGQFYTEAVIWASANGIVNGYEDGSFRPGDVITREQIVTMLYRYVVSLGKDNGERNDLSAFEDLDMLRAYALEPMQWAVANGVINGLSETTLGAQESANRAQTVTILYRIITGTLAE